MPWLSPLKQRQEGENSVDLTLRSLYLWFSLLTPGTGGEEEKGEALCDFWVPMTMPWWQSTSWNLASWYYVLWGKSKEPGGVYVSCGI